MPVPVHHLVTFRGHMGTASTPRETWSFGLRFRPASATLGATASDTLAQNIVNQLRTEYETLHATTNSLFMNTVFFDEVRAYNIGPDGKATGAPRIATESAPVPGSSTNHTMPWQGSLAVTLDAGYPAKGRFGRFYLPPQALTIEDTGLVMLTQAQSIFTNVQAFLAAVSNLTGLDTGFGLAVVGGTGPDGTMRDVDRIRLGRVVDTQRRRRRQVAEAYLESDFTP